jgi:integrase/recombinase XerD
MTHLRKMMLEELERRNCAQSTIHCYLRAVTEFSFHFHRPPNQLGPEHIRQYQAQLFGRRKLAPHLVLMTLYATGVRRAELTRLKITDIDSRRMIIHIQGGKGRKDRDVMLSPKLLEALREYWRGLRRKPTTWLFPGGRWHTANHPITSKVVWDACHKAAQRAGIRKKIHPHTLRHYLPFLTMSCKSARTRFPGCLIEAV